MLIQYISSVLDFKISLGYQKAAQNEESKHSINTILVLQVNAFSLPAVFSNLNQKEVFQSIFITYLTIFKTLFQFVPRRQCNFRII